MYGKILADNEYQQIMNKISSFQFIDDGKWDWEHGREHALRVSEYTKRILSDLKVDAHDIELGMIAALLHDIGLSSGTKKNHAEKSAEMAQKYLQKWKIGNIDKKKIIDAIKDHSNGKNIKSFIGAALLLADKLDISYHRVKNSSIRDEINMEFSKINRVDVEICGDYIYIFFKTFKKFNPQIFKNWEKPLTIPYMVAKYLNKKCIIKLNHENLEIESVVGKEKCKQIC